MYMQAVLVLAFNRYVILWLFLISTDTFASSYNPDTTLALLQTATAQAEEEAEVFILCACDLLRMYVWYEQSLQWKKLSDSEEMLVGRVMVRKERWGI